MLENENNVKETELQETNDKKEDEYEKFCFMCRRPESVAGKMIEVPIYV